MPLVFFLIVAMFPSCQRGKGNTNKDLTLDAFSGMETHLYNIDYHAIRKSLAALSAHDTGKFAADKRTRQYYRDGRPLLWVDYHGAGREADTLLRYLRETLYAGTDTGIFRLNTIRNDMTKLRQLDFDGGEGINDVIARLEYNLTRAFLRYAATQRFGFVNPGRLLNHLEVKDSGGGKTIYHHLYDIPVQRADDGFYARAFSALAHDSVEAFLEYVQPANPLYIPLTEKLRTAATGAEREKIICNIERCRWRQSTFPPACGKYVTVNIPAFALYAVDGDSTLPMKVICGSKKAKTPLLTSSIARMDVNPKWIVPPSIAKGYVHDTAYMRREHMYILDKERGRVDYHEASMDKVARHEQYLIQEGGAWNSLGRIIFRFPNNFSVYLHDTSSPRLFARRVRAMSHGCVRVEKPLALASFLLGAEDKKTAERIEYSMTIDPNDPDAAGKDKAEATKAIASVSVKPEVPLFINYYTCYPDSSGELKEYDDIYGYDEAIINELRPYIK